MTLSRTRREVVESMAAAAGGRDSVMKFWACAAQKVEGGVQFDTATNLEPAHVVWLLERIIGRLQAKIAEGEAAAVNAALSEAPKPVEEGKDAGPVAQGG